MKKYIAFFKTQLIMGLQYKTAAISGLLTQFFWGILFAFIYVSFYSQANIDSISLLELMSYTWLGQAFFSLTYLNNKDAEIMDSIRMGTVAYELTKPYDLYTWWFVKCTAKRYAKVALRSLPILIFGVLLPYPYNLSAPISMNAFIWFIITLVIGSLVLTGINMIIYTLSFFTMQDKGIASIVYAVGALIGGMTLPLPLLPKIINDIAEYLPFRLIGDLPFRIYSGNISGDYAIKSIILGIIWTILLIILGKLFTKKALKKVCIQGG